MLCCLTPQAGTWLVPFSVEWEAKREEIAKGFVEPVTLYLVVSHLHPQVKPARVWWAMNACALLFAWNISAQQQNSFSPLTDNKDVSPLLQMWLQMVRNARKRAHMIATPSLNSVKIPVMSTLWNHGFQPSSQF